MTSTTMTARVWVMLLALSLLWGGSFFLVEVALGAFPPVLLVWLRVALAAAALLSFLGATGRRLPADRAALGAFLGMGLLNNAIPFTLIAWGQTGIGSGLASILNATTPVMTVLLAHALTEDERLGPARLAGVGFGLAGVAALIGPDALAGAGGQALAELAVLGAALSYGFAAVWGRRFRRMGLDPVTAAAGQVSASTLILAPPALLLARPWELAAPSAGALAGVAALALLSTALAYVLYFRILAAAGAGNVSLVTFLVPPSAILLGWLFLGEALGPAEAAGMALIAIGLACIDGRLLRGRAAGGPAAGRTARDDAVRPGRTHRRSP